jgi:hypothetical protein
MGQFSRHVVKHDRLGYSRMTSSAGDSRLAPRETAFVRDVVSTSLSRPAR